MEAFLEKYTRDAYPFMSSNGRDGALLTEFSQGSGRPNIPTLLDLVYERDVVRMIVNKEDDGGFDKVYPTPSESEKRKMAVR